MACFNISKLLLPFLILLSFKTSCNALEKPNTNSSKTITSLNTKDLSSITSLCRKAPHPETCMNTLKLSISITIGPNILNYLLRTLDTAISEAAKLSDLLSTAGQGNNLVEKHRGTIADCRELHQITLNSLRRSASRLKDPSSRNVADARAYLSAGVTNKATCLEGLESASGPLKPVLVSSIASAYEHVSNSLSMLAKPGVVQHGGNNRRRRRLMGWSPSWLGGKSRRLLLETSGDDYDPSDVITVARDGTGNFTTIGEAVNYAPNNSFDRVIVLVRKGVYEENVEIPSYKTNIVFIGDGSDVTVITGDRSFAGGWTTFRSATLAVSGEGFLARDIAVVNTAGPEKHQAVAVRINADFAALYRCTFTGFQDTLYTHSFRQFFRECDIFGTIDYIFGNAAVIFQNSNVVSRLPMPGQFTVVTAQSRETPDEVTGMSFQNCSILATEDLYAAAAKVKSYLGRPWRDYSRTVFLESYIDVLIDPSGWTEWSGDQGLNTLYYGEYQNYGPGSGTDKRVGWPGFHVMERSDALNFTASEFITGYAWLESTSFPYDDGI